MSIEAEVLDITRSQLIAAPPARVLAAFFDLADLAGWWQVTRAVNVPRPLGMYAIEWESTDFSDDVLGRLGGTFHGTIVDYRPNAAFFVAEAYWQPPDGDPIGPMALEVHCRPHGNGRATMLSVRQSGEGEGPRWQRYFAIMERGWDAALQELKEYMEKEAARTRNPA
jgi:uncharacterized protein YndB with AHSA1/START domain